MQVILIKQWIIKLLKTLYFCTSSLEINHWNVHCFTPVVMGGFLVPQHYSDVITGAMVSQITSLTIVYSTVYSGTDQIQHQSSASLAFVRGIHRWPVNSPHKGSVTRKMFPFGDVIMTTKTHCYPKCLSSAADTSAVKPYQWDNILKPWDRRLDTTRFVWQNIAQYFDSYFVIFLWEYI